MALPEEPEGKFVERIVQRDERAFSELVRTYERNVVGLIARMLGSQAEAEEVAQEVFIQVFKAIGSFRGESKLSTWIYRIAVNHCKNRSKYLKVRHAGEQDELEAVAERVAGVCLANPRIRCVCVRVAKSGAVAAAAEVAVRITRSQDGSLR